MPSPPFLLKGKAEAIFLTGSGFVATGINVILQAAIEERIAPVSHLPDYVDQGVLLGAGADMKELGRAAALKIEAILKGTLPTNIPVDGPKRMLLYINMKTAKALGIKIPEDLRKKAEKIYE